MAACVACGFLGMYYSMCADGCEVGGAGRAKRVECPQQEGWQGGRQGGIMKGGKTTRYG